MKLDKNISRSTFGFKYPVKGTFNLGEICPIGAPIEIVPGDELKADMGIVLRMATPIAPIMDDLDAEITAHFVPLRLVGTSTGDYTFTGSYAANGSIKTFEKIIGNGVGNPAEWVATSNELYTAPTANWNASNARRSDYTTIGEALGLGLGIDGNNVNISVCAYQLFGYNLIYNTRFRNENVEAEKTDLSLVSNLYGCAGIPSAQSDTNLYYNNCLSVAYKHGDRITNALPAPTKGPQVRLNLGTEAPLYWTNGGTSSITSGNWLIGGYGTGQQANLGATNAAQIIDQGDLGDSQAWETGRLYANLEQATASTINQFITSFNVQRLLMNDVKGTRYYEIIKNHYHVENEDIRLYIPELLNLRRFAINISPVVQQSGSAAATSATDQGNYLGTTGGYSFTANHGSLVHNAFGEFGLVYFLIVCRQRHTYGQGIPKQYLRKTRFDFFFPELGRIGYQAIVKRQLNAEDSGTDVYGYEPAWEELRRVNEAQAFGFLNPSKTNSLDYWTLTDKWTSTPTLSISFLKERRNELGRALTIGTTGPDFIMDAMIYGKKSTLVPIGSEPKLFN